MKYLLVLHGGNKLLLHGAPTYKDEKGNEEKNETKCIWQIANSYYLNKIQCDKLGMVSLLVYEDYEVEVSENIAYIIK